MSSSCPEHEAHAEESLATLRTKLGILVENVHSVLDDIEAQAQELVQEEAKRAARGDNQQGG